MSCDCLNFCWELANLCDFIFKQPRINKKEKNTFLKNLSLIELVTPKGGGVGEIKSMICR